MSYLPQYSSDLCNLELHGCLLEKNFPTVCRLHQSDTQVESYDRFNLPPLKNPRIIVQLRELLCLACNGGVWDPCWTFKACLDSLFACLFDSLPIFGLLLHLQL
eukprot:TRINITY_DN21350_c0_g1_i2.p1 TRINITY_DN21350_c0_g1~~TRINITY_DN21350_c0_g1_i2.p1  ORF type:complete len:104 (-),score=5.04 TRINITY_DN21350_c0_g1_i2:15-326(-)